MPSYTTAQKVKDYLQITNFNHSGIDAQIDSWIEAVSDWIDKYTGTTFEAETTTKLYDGSGTHQLIVDHFTTLEKIELLDEDGNVDESTTDSTNWFTYPPNSKPKYRIDLNQLGNDFMTVFPRGQQNIKVYADFGYGASVPKTIELVATMLVAEIVKNHDRQLGDIKSESLGDYSVTYGEIDKAASELGAREMLNQYLRYWV